MVTNTFKSKNGRHLFILQVKAIQIRTNAKMKQRKMSKGKEKKKVSFLKLAKSHGTKNYFAF